MGVIKVTVLTLPGAAHGLPGADDVFGCTLTVLLALLSLLLTAWSGESNPIPLMLGALCYLMVLWSPASLRWLNRMWKNTTLGLAQIVFSIYWVCYILPTGILMQVSGRDPLDLRFQPEARTYWKKPHPTGNMQKQA